MSVKKCIFLLMLLCGMSFAGGCASEILSEAQMRKMLPKELFEIDYAGEIYSGSLEAFVIEERETNKFKGKDNIRCKLVIENDYYECTKYVEVCLNYIENEWVVDSWDYYEKESIEVIIAPPVSEEDLIKSLPEEVLSVTINNEVLPMEISSFEVEKRKTNLDDKTDIAWCIITVENEYYKFTKHVTLTHSYYDVKGGWILDEWGYNADEEYCVKKNPLYEEDILTLLTQFKDGRDYSLSFKECTENLENNSIIYTYVAQSEDEYCVSTWLEFCFYSFDGNTWVYDIDSSDRSKEWNLIGEYRLKKLPDDYCGFYMNITEFDLENNKIDGWCNFSYSNPMAWSYKSKMYYLSDAEIEVTNTYVKILLDGIGQYWQTDIIFYYHNASANYDSYWEKDIVRY